MSSSTAKKLEFTKSEIIHQAEILHLKPAEIAQTAEAASHLPHNTEGCDYEVYMAAYGMKNTWSFE